MKKILFAIAIVLTISLTANAQGKNDGFFSNWDNGLNDRTGSEPLTPGIAFPTHNTDQDPQAPLGSGLLILTAIGAGYALKRRRDPR